MFLIPKGYKGDFWGFGLVEVLCNTITGLLNRRFNSETFFHDVLHGVLVGCGWGTAALDSKLLKHITSMREVVLHNIFLDLHKSYDALDWDRCLEIVVVCGMGPRALWLPRTY